jgi:microcin C transport system permease protein
VLSDISRERFNRFRAIKRAWFAFLVLTAAFVLSLFSEDIANDRPLLLFYQGHYYFPTVQFYPATDFGGPYKTEPDYVALRNDPTFHAAGGWMILPPISHDPLHYDFDLSANPPNPPSWKHWLGTDGSGRDVLARLIYGFRIAMLFSLALTIVSTVAGIAIGAVQGYAGGRVDLTAQRFIEIWSALPYLYVVILMGAIYGQGFGILLLVTSLFQWITLSYYIRGEFYKLREQAYVLASRALGASHTSVLFRQILPNAMTPVITMLPFTLIAGISSLTALDFLGFGLPPPTPSWGELIDEGLQNLQAPWLAGSAVAALFITLMLATMIGEGIRDALDPKSLTKLR